MCDSRDMCDKRDVCDTHDTCDSRDISEGSITYLRIEFEILLFTFKVFNKLETSYICDLVKFCETPHTLRSESKETISHAQNTDNNI